MLNRLGLMPTYSCSSSASPSPCPPCSQTTPAPPASINFGEAVAPEHIFFAPLHLLSQGHLALSRTNITTPAINLHWTIAILGKKRFGNTMPPHPNRSNSKSSLIIQPAAMRETKFYQHINSFVPKLPPRGNSWGSTGPQLARMIRKQFLSTITAPISALAGLLWEDIYYCSVTNLSPGMQCFGLKQLVPLCFWGFGSNGAHLGQEKAVLGPNRVCKKVDFSQKHHIQICSNRTKMALWGH